MGQDVAFRLKSYMKDLLTRNLAKEYADQVEKWKLYLEDIADAANTASSKVRDTLVEADAEERASEEQAYGIGMLLLGMVVGPAVSWLGAMVKNKWAPKITNTESIMTQTKVAWRTDPLGKEYIQYVPEGVVTTVKSEVLNTIFGDAAKGVGGFVFDITKKALNTTGQAKNPAQSLVGEIPVLNWESFRIGLMRSLYKVQNAASAQIQEIANAIENDYDFGDRLLEKLLKEQPALKHR